MVGGRVESARFLAEQPCRDREIDYRPDVRRDKLRRRKARGQLFLLARLREPQQPPGDLPDRSGSIFDRGLFRAIAQILPRKTSIANDRAANCGFFFSDSWLSSQYFKLQRSAFSLRDEIYDASMRPSAPRDPLCPLSVKKWFDCCPIWSLPGFSARRWAKRNGEQTPHVVHLQLVGSRFCAGAIRTMRRGLQSFL